MLVEPGKHDRVALTIGRADQPSQPVYGPELSLSWTDIKFELDATEEPRVRAFFEAVASASGRI